MCCFSVVISLGKYDGMLIWGNFNIRGIFAAMTKEFIEWKTMVRYWTLTNLPIQRNRSPRSVLKNDQAPQLETKDSKEFKKIDL
jgi:hypothetical protein